MYSRRNKCERLTIQFIMKRMWELYLLSKSIKYTRLIMFTLWKIINFSFFARVYKSTTPKHLVFVKIHWEKNQYVIHNLHFIFSLLPITCFFLRVKWLYWKIVQWNRWNINERGLILHIYSGSGQRHWTPKKKKWKWFY